MKHVLFLHFASATSLASISPLHLVLSIHFISSTPSNITSPIQHTSPASTLLPASPHSRGHGAVNVRHPGLDCWGIGDNLTRIAAICLHAWPRRASSTDCLQPPLPCPDSLIAHLQPPALPLLPIYSWPFLLFQSPNSFPSSLKASHSHYFPLAHPLSIPTYFLFLLFLYSRLVSLTVSIVSLLPHNSS